MKNYILLLGLLLLFAAIAYAVPSHEGSQIDAQPVVAYGKYGGNIVAIKVASDGTLSIR